MQAFKLFRIKNALYVWYKHIWQTSWRYLWILLVPLFIAILQWLLNIQSLRYILTGDNNLSVVERFDVFVDGVGSVLTNINDWTPISFILIAVFQSTALLLYIKLRREAKLSKKDSLKQASSMGVAIIGAGCVACGGSLVTPLLSLLATNVSISLAQSIGDILLGLAVILSAYALLNISWQPHLRQVKK